MFHTQRAPNAIVQIHTYWNFDVQTKIEIFLFFPIFYSLSTQSARVRIEEKSGTK